MKRGEMERGFEQRTENTKSQNHNTLTTKQTKQTFYLCIMWALCGTSLSFRYEPNPHALPLQNLPKPRGPENVNVLAVFPVGIAKPLPASHLPSRKVGIIGVKLQLYNR